MRAYSQDLRDRVLSALEKGERPTQIAKRFEVSRVWVYLVGNRLRSEGKRTSLQIGGYRKSRLLALEPVLRSWIEDRADMTLAEMRERLAAEHAVTIQIPALWNQLDRWGLSYKKNVARQRARAARRSASTDRVEAKPTRTRHHEARVSR